MAIAAAAAATAADLSESIQSGNGISLQRQDDVPEQDPFSRPVPNNPR